MFPSPMSGYHTESEFCSAQQLVNLLVDLKKLNTYNKAKLTDLQNAMI
jgi:hypothetical protein